MSIKSIKYFLLVFILTSTFQLSAQNGGSLDAEAAGMSVDRLSGYDHFLQSEVNDYKLAGAVSLVYRKGHLSHQKAIGYNKLSEGSPMTEDKIFYIQSMTKPIISVAFMMLYEEGHFLLDDPVAQYLPVFDSLKVMQWDFNEDGSIKEVSYVSPKSPVRIWHLLSHTAGFSHGLGQNDYDKKLRSLLYEQEHKTIEDRVKALLSYPLMGHPGEQWNYSAAPDVLALLIEHFSGMTTDQFLKERIFLPLGMEDTGYNVKETNLGRVAGLHELQEDGKLKTIDHWSPLQGNTVYGGTHGLFSTAADYMKFGQMLLNKGAFNGKRLLSRKTLELMTENHVDKLPYSEGNGFGLGFGLRTDISDSKISGSEGIFYWSGAFNTYFMVDPKEDLVAILMTQSYPYSNFNGTKMRQFIYSSIND